LVILKIITVEEIYVDDLIIHKGLNLSYNE
jgi:hypothetical protein